MKWREYAVNGKRENGRKMRGKTIKRKVENKHGTVKQER